jgi:isoleucyl-tRNA synthetase
MDKWVLSRLNSLIKKVCADLDGYRITEPARAISDFVDELSNWYIRRGRASATGAAAWTGNKKAAYMTLYTVRRRQRG